MLPSTGLSQSKSPERLGIAPPEQLDDAKKTQSVYESEIERLRKTHVDGVSLAQRLRRQDITYQDLPNPPPNPLSVDAVRQVEIWLKYEGYIDRENVKIQQASRLEKTRIPSDFDYQAISALRKESMEKLDRVRPATLGQASRISGVNPADIAILSVWIKRKAGTSLKNS